MSFEPVSRSGRRVADRGVRRLLAGLLALASIAVGCGGDDSGDTGGVVEPATSAATPTSTPQPTGQSTEQSTDTTSSAPSTSSVPGTETTAAGGLTATWRGVTADTIRIGVATYDFDAIAELGIEIPTPPSDLVERLTQVTNDQGGIGGRRLEVVAETFLPLGTASAEAACTALVVEHEVFLVTGSLTEDTPLCVTETHETIYIGTTGYTAERGERSRAPFFSVTMGIDEQRVKSLQALLDEGDLDGSAVALYHEAGDGDLAETAADLLAVGGVEVVSELRLDELGQDTTAIAAALDTLIERARADGADTVVSVSDSVLLAVALERNAFEGSVVFLGGDASTSGTLVAAGVDPAFLERAVAVTVHRPTLDELVADPLLGDCVDDYNSTDPAEPIDLGEMGEGEAQILALTCQTSMLVELLLTEAGPDLDPDAVVAAAESLGSFELPGMVGPSLGPGKFTAGNAVRIFDFDPTTGAPVPRGAPIVVS